MARKTNGEERGGWEGRRDRLREIYRRHACTVAGDVDMSVVRASIEAAALAALDGWRTLASLDHVSLAEAGSREEFEDLEFLVNRGLSELNGVKNILVLARRLA